VPLISALNQKWSPLPHADPSAQMGLREMRAQGSFERTLADLYLNVALMVILVFTITICAGAYGAKSLKLTRPDKPMLRKEHQESPLIAELISPISGR
jgi:hypothetical protein